MKGIKLCFGLFALVGLFGNPGAAQPVISGGAGSAYNYYSAYHKGVGAGGGVRAGLEFPVYRQEHFRFTLGMLCVSSSASARYRPAHGYEYSYRWRNTGLLGRLSAHYDFTEKVAFYGALSAGVVFTRFSEFKTGPAYPNYTSPYFPRSLMRIGAAVGINYAFTDAFGGFSEFAYDMLWFSVGLRYKLKTK